MHTVRSPKRERGHNCKGENGATDNCNRFDGARWRVRRAWEGSPLEDAEEGLGLLGPAAGQDHFELGLEQIRRPLEPRGHPSHASYRALGGSPRARGNPAMATALGAGGGGIEGHQSAAAFRHPGGGVGVVRVRVRVVFRRKLMPMELKNWRLACGVFFGD